LTFTCDGRIAGGKCLCITSCFQDFKLNKTWFQWVWRLFYVESNVQVGKSYL
jgi:hypothetical protein